MTRPSKGSSDPLTIAELLDRSAAYLCRRGVAEPRLDAEYLLAHALATRRMNLYISYHSPVPEEKVAVFRELVKKRAGREPLQYITGEREFYGVELKTDARALIPRRETECLVDVVVDFLSGLAPKDNTEQGEASDEQRLPYAAKPETTLLDVGTGCGAVAIAVLAEVPSGRATATDISREALELASENSHRASVSTRMELLEGDLLSPVSGRKFDAIAANLPYVPSSQLDQLGPEVRDFEPRIALDGGSDGLDLMRCFLREAPSYASNPGLVALEVGLGQAAEVADIMNRTGAFETVRIFRDGARIERVVAGWTAKAVPA